MRTTCVLLVLCVLSLGAAQETRTYVARYLQAFPGPQVYKDVHTGTVLYVETDGRHVAAISRDGKLLWNRDPFKDARLEFYRTKNPQIVYIGPVSKSGPYAGKQPERLAAITFNNPRSGC